MMINASISRKFSILLACISMLMAAVVLVKPSSVYAQSPQYNDTYTTATVVEIVSEEKVPVDNNFYYIQQLRVKDKKTGKTYELKSGDTYQPISDYQRAKVGDTVIISKQDTTDGQTYVLNDTYRMPVLIGLLVMFGLLVVFVAGRQGTFSILGMVLSLVILVSFIVPHILAGENPFFVTLLGASITAIITMYLSHGFKRQTHIALFSMVLCLGVVALLSTLAVHLGHFVGLGSEEAAYLQFGSTQKINLQGLLLAGIMLGALGILDDITLAQTAVIEQLKAVHPKITFHELYMRGLIVGKDHVASLVNTLVFAYAGTSLPLFLLFTIYRTQPAWVSINSEVIAEEVVRTLVGSIGLVLAVPLTTLIASYYVSRHAKA